jgi:hypothetical protein
MVFRTLVVLSLAASTALAQTPDSPMSSGNAPLPSGSEATPTEKAAQAPTEEEHPAFRIGVILGLVSVPRPVNVEVHVKFFDVIGIGGSYTYMPKFVGDWLLSLYNASYSDLSVTSSSWELALRIHPARGAFFLGANLGMGDVTAVLIGSTRNATAKVSGPFVAPRLGWLWIWSSGITMGLDAGVQIPIGDATITYDPPAFRDVPQLRRAAETVGKTLLPVLNFRIGYSL